MYLNCWQCGRRASHSAQISDDDVRRRPGCMEHAVVRAETIGQVGGSMLLVLDTLARRGPMATVQLIHHLWPGANLGAHRGSLVACHNLHMTRRWREGRRVMNDVTDMGVYVLTECTRGA